MVTRRFIKERFSERSLKLWDKGDSGCIAIGNFKINIYKNYMSDVIVVDLHYKDSPTPFGIVNIGGNEDLSSGVITNNQIDIDYTLIDRESKHFNIELIDSLLNIHSIFVTLFGSPRVQSKYLNKYPTTLEGKQALVSEAIFLVATFYLNIMPFLKGLKRNLEKAIREEGVLKDIDQTEHKEPYIRVLIDREQMGKLLFNKGQNDLVVICDVMAFEYVGGLNLTDGLFIPYEKYVRDITEEKVERLLQSKRLKTPNRHYTVLHMPYLSGYDITNEVLLQPIFITK